MKNLVAGGDLATVQAVRQVMIAGGNAIDGAVAGGFMAMIAESTLTSAGGGGVMMVSLTRGEPVVFDFFADTPRGEPAALDFQKVTVDFGPATQDFHIGRGSAAVPGNLAGLLHAHEWFGQLDRRAVLAPAITAAREGVGVSAQQAVFIANLEPILTHSSGTREVYAPEGRLLGEGDRLVLPAFAESLEALAENGADVFYRGAIAEEIVDWAREGGLIQREDLANYRVAEREPLVCKFAGHEVLLNPPPATSGEMVQRTLERFSYEIDLIKSLEAESAPDHGVGSTTHLSVLDAAGNAVSLTTTNGEGCGEMLPRSGFMLNNMLGEADLSPSGFHRHPPGTRLPTMMAPTIVRRDGEPVLVTGTGGSNRIGPVMVQVLANVLGRGMALEEAVLAPRVHCDGGVIHVEEGFPLAEWDEARLNRVNAWPGRSLFFGGAHSVSPTAAVGDPRRSGCALEFD